MSSSTNGPRTGADGGLGALVTGAAVGAVEVPVSAETPSRGNSPGGAVAGTDGLAAGVGVAGLPWATAVSSGVVVPGSRLISQNARPRMTTRPTESQTHTLGSTPPPPTGRGGSHVCSGSGTSSSGSGGKLI